MNKIVSIAVFGEGDRYSQYLATFIIAHLNLFPREEGWSLRVHHDDGVQRGMDTGATASGRLLAGLAARGLIDARCMGPAILTKAMLWRTAPVFELGADHVFSRDLDALPMPRDRAAMEQFMASRAAVSTIHDSMSHAGIMGGLCGFNTAEFRRLTGFLSLDAVYAYAWKRLGVDDARWAEHGTDQVVLNQMTVTFPQMTLLEHRYNGWASGKPGDFRRAPMTYACEAWSTPTPDSGGKWSPEADALAPHLGSAGYDHTAARAFWEERGDREIARVVRECEGA